MKLRQILNWTESTIISAKSFNANNDMAEVRNRLWNLKDFLEYELTAELAEAQPAEHPAAQPAERPAEPTKQASGDHVSAEDAAFAEAERATEQPAGGQAESPNEPAAGSIKPFELPEKMDGRGIVSAPSESNGKDGSGKTSKPDKSQNRDGSGISE